MTHIDQSRLAFPTLLSYRAAGFQADFFKDTEVSGRTILDVYLDRQTHIDSDRS